MNGTFTRKNTASNSSEKKTSLWSYITAASVPWNVNPGHCFAEQQNTVRGTKYICYDDNREVTYIRGVNWKLKFKPTEVICNFRVTVAV